MCDKACEKIHKISDNIYCCGAGTAADTQQVTGEVLLLASCNTKLVFAPDMVASQLELHRMSTGRQSRVGTALAMLKQFLFR